MIEIGLVFSITYAHGEKSSAHRIHLVKLLRVFNFALGARVIYGIESD